MCELRKRYRVRDIFVCFVSKRYVCSQRKIGRKRMREKEKDCVRENERGRER